MYNGGVLYHFGYLEEECMMVNCIIGSCEVDKDSACDLFVLRSILYELSEVQDLATA